MAEIETKQQVGDAMLSELITLIYALAGEFNCSRADDEADQAEIAEWRRRWKAARD